MLVNKYFCLLEQWLFKASNYFLNSTFLWKTCLPGHCPPNNDEGDVDLHARLHPQPKLHYRNALAV